MSYQNLTRKQHIENAITDCVANLLYYDRKEDQDLPLNAIENAVKAGEISKQEMVDLFARCLGDL